MSNKTRRFAVALCLTPAVYCFLIVGYALVNYSDFLSDTPRFLRYFVGPLIIGSLLILSGVLLAEDTSLIVGVSATAFLVTLFLFEGYITLKLLPRQAGAVGVVSSDVDLSPFKNSLPPAYTIKALNSELGIERLNEAALSLEPGSRVMLCSRMEQPVTYVADSRGFRNPSKEPLAPIDMMVLGDSFSEGICLEEGEHFVDKLREEVPSLVNTGSRGAGPLFELAVLGRYGPHLRPKIVIIAFFEGNDWENLDRELGVPWLSDALAPNADFGEVEWTEERRSDVRDVSRTWWTGSAVTMKEYVGRRSFLRNFLALQNTAAILGLHYPKASSPNPVYAQILGRTREIVDGWGGRVFVVYIASLDRFRGVFPHGFVYEPLQEMVRKDVEAAGLGWIDLASEFASHPDPGMLYSPDAHFSAEGADLAAEKILEALEVKRLDRSSNSHEHLPPQNLHFGAHSLGRAGTHLEL